MSIFETLKKYGKSKNNAIAEAIKDFNEFKTSGYIQSKRPSSGNIEVAIQALQAQAERRWIPVSEKMPDNCGMPLLLVGVNGYGQRRVFQGFTGYMKRGTLLFFSNTRDVDINAWNITHWMPLPEPPKEDNNG
jgi:hypothetical protein